MSRTHREEGSGFTEALLSKGFQAPVSGLVMGSGLGEVWKGPASQKVAQLCFLS